MRLRASTMVCPVSRAMAVEHTCVPTSECQHSCAQRYNLEMSAQLHTAAAHVYGSRQTQLTAIRS